MKKLKILFVSSSGGHWQQLKILSEHKFKKETKSILVTEKTKIKDNDADYYLFQTDSKDKLMFLKMTINSIKSFFIWMKFRPDIIITTGTLVAYPFYLMKILFKKKFIYIETFGRANMPTLAGKKMEKHSDLFIVQWETQTNHYRKAIYGGTLY